MTNERWTELMIASRPEFTREENSEGWHFCCEYDGLLRCEGPTCATCGYTPTEFISSRVEPTELQREWMEMLPRIHACGYGTLEGDEFDRERRKHWEELIAAHNGIRDYDPTHDENGNVAYTLFRPLYGKELPLGTQWAGGRNGLQFEDDPRAGTIPESIDMSLVYRHPIKRTGHGHGHCNRYGSLSAWVR